MEEVRGFLTPVQLIIPPLFYGALISFRVWTNQTPYAPRGAPGYLIGRGLASPLKGGVC